MDISDTPFFVTHGYSIPLDERGKNGKIKPVKRPLADWAQEIIDLREKASETSGDAIRLIHFRPLNDNDNHFTLLEINEREGKIRHYNPMANRNVIEGTAKPTRVARLVQARNSFKDRDGDKADAVIRGVWSFEIRK
jgi:hypothetical protein